MFTAQPLSFSQDLYLQDDWFTEVANILSIHGLPYEKYFKIICLELMSRWYLVIFVAAISQNPKKKKKLGTQVQISNCLNIIQY